MSGPTLYRYNGFELRVYKSGPTAIIPTGAAYYVYDEGRLLGEYDANGVPVYETVYLGSSPVNVLKQTGTAAQNNIATSLYNVYSDHLATPRVITRASDEAIVWRWDSAEAFGATAPDQNPNNLGAFVFNQRLPGQVYDYETGLFQNWNREYNARLGRYLESDPLGLVAGINTYAYVGGNPLSAIDPTGLRIYRSGNTYTDVPTPGPDWQEADTHGGDYIYCWSSNSGSGSQGGYDNGGGTWNLPPTTSGDTPLPPTPIDKIIREVTSPWFWLPGGMIVRGAKGVGGAARGITREILERKALGRDGARSIQIIERESGTVISRTHEVTKEGQIIHQHQNHSGKYGGERQFPEEWTGTKTINAPYENIPPSFPADRVPGGRRY